jgi:3-keto-disaccharide hydrolase
MKISFSSPRCGRLGVAALLLSFATAGLAAEAGIVPPPKEEPRIIDPGPPPSDAIVLFNGHDLSRWQAADGSPTKWIVKEAAMQPVKEAGYIWTKQSFGDCQLHIEWATPDKVEGEGQGRGNSGVFFGGQRYEVQVLDSYNNKTYYHGQAGAIYNQYAPLVNASRKPGQWQTYDIVYHAPRFDNQNKLVQPGTFTVLHNGVLIQDHVSIMGSTTHDKPAYEPHPVKQPIALQDHGNPVRFRNVWIREL